ncbi:ABC transporter permease [Actinoplanes sp. CA-142083]|uniref:ABC transporter permease n=1 Tax=Actinoplanes sp. CA-142083 TaxID=3239903 RepID=UPI003D8AC4AC
MSIPLPRLTLVELRKLADTRAGLWMLVLIALGVVGTAVILLGWAPDEEQTFADFFAFGLAPSTVLLPVLGILSMTGEWSQRTALTTFALVPSRLRVVTAKLAAGVLIALATTAVTLLFAAAANVLAAALGGDGGWHVDGSLIWQGALTEVLFLMVGMAFGALLQNSPLAIVAFFALPTIWGILRETIKSLERVSGWLDLGLTSGPLSEPSMTAGEYGRLAVSCLVWVALPLVLGSWRILRREIA